MASTQWGLVGAAILMPQESVWQIAVAWWVGVTALNVRFTRPVARWFGLRVRAEHWLVLGFTQPMHVPMLLLPKVGCSIFWASPHTQRGKAELARRDCIPLPSHGRRRRRLDPFVGDRGLGGQSTLDQTPAQWPMHSTWTRGMLSPGSTWVDDVGASQTAWLGTDRYGRDLLSRLMAGSGISLSVGAGAVLISLLLGLLLGGMAGYLGGALMLCCRGFCK